jgi:hypothetical protein
MQKRHGGIMESTYCPITRCYTDVYDADGNLIHGCIACDPDTGRYVVRMDDKENGANADWTWCFHNTAPKPLRIDR